MGINFPTSPVVGTLWPNPPVSGQPVYTWDGKKWGSGSAQGAIYQSDSPPSAPAGSLWFESDTGILYYNYKDVDSTQWCAIAQGGSGGIRFDQAQNLTEPQKVQARQNVYAAPFDAMAYSGMQINGSMEVSQENGLGPVTVPAGSTSVNAVDGWQIVKTGTSILRWYQINGITGYGSRLQLEVMTAQPTIGADFIRISTKIEGYRITRLAWGTATAVPVTVGFWFTAAIAGTYRALMHNFDATSSSPPLPFTITTPSVKQWVTLTFSPVTTGTWKTDNSIGLVFAIEVASSATPNFAATVGNICHVTGVVVLPGIEAPSAERSPFIMRPYGQELITCMRYYQKYLGLMAQGNSGGGTAIYCDYGIYPMRAVPTAALSNFINLNAANAQLNVAAINHLRLSALITATGYGYSVADVALDARL